MKLPVLFYVYLYSSAIPIIAGFLRIQRLNRGAKIFYVLTVVGLMFTLAEIYLAKQHMHNLWLVHLYRLIWLPAVAYMLSLWTGQEISKVVLRWVMITYVAFWCVAKLTLEPLTGGWDAYTSTTSNILLISFSVYFLTFSNWKQGDNLPNAYYVVILSGILLLSIGDLFLFAMGDKFITLTKLEGVNIYRIHWAVNSIANVMFAYGFWSLRDPECQPVTARETIE